MPANTARLAVRMGSGMWWPTEGLAWRGFSLSWPKEGAVPRHEPETAPFCIKTRAGLMQVPDLSLLQLVSGVPVDKDRPDNVRRDMLRLACSMLDEEVNQVFLGGIQPEWQPALGDNQTMIRVVLTLLPTQHGEAHSFDLYMSCTTAWLWLEDPRWEAVNEMNEAGRVDRLDFKAVLRLGEQHLPLKALAALTVGDAVLLGQKRLSSFASMEAVIGSYTMQVRGVGRGEWAFEQLQQQHNEEEMSTESNAYDATEDNFDEQSIVNIDDLPVKLVFTLGEVTLSLSHIRALAAGGVIHLNRPARAHVNILANGQLLARGELIDVDDRLAVEITSMARAHHEPD